MASPVVSINGWVDALTVESAGVLARVSWILHVVFFDVQVAGHEDTACDVVTGVKTLLSLVGQSVSEVRWVVDGRAGEMV